MNWTPEEIQQYIDGEKRTDALVAEFRFQMDRSNQRLRCMTHDWSRTIEELHKSRKAPIDNRAVLWHVFSKHFQLYHISGQPIFTQEIKHWQTGEWEEIGTV